MYLCNAVCAKASAPPNTLDHVYGKASQVNPTRSPDQLQVTVKLVARRHQAVTNLLTISYSYGNVEVAGCSLRHIHSGSSRPHHRPVERLEYWLEVGPFDLRGSGHQEPLAAATTGLLLAWGNVSISTRRLVVCAIAALLTFIIAQPALTPS